MVATLQLQWLWLLELLSASAWVLGGLQMPLAFLFPLPSGPAPSKGSIHFNSWHCACREERGHCNHWQILLCDVLSMDFSGEFSFILEILESLFPDRGKRQQV
jgi:hypothetical protein